VLLAFVTRYGPKAGADGPPRFVREVLKAEPDEWQELVLRDYGRGERQISIESCHGPGKTTVLAWLILIQAATRFPQKTACTAPTGGQLSDALIAEVKTWHRKLPEELQGLFDIKSDRLSLVFAPERSFATFRTARPENPEALQGVHAPWVLLIADEASGVAGAIFESAIGSMSGSHACTILAGNPVRTTGFFFNSQHGDGATRWKRYHISGIEGPHCGENSYVSKRVDPEFVAMVAAEYGEDSNAFRVRVLGRPPKSDSDAIVPFEWVEAAYNRDVKVNPLAPIVWGVDVARSGNDLVTLAKRKANTLCEAIKYWPAAELNDVMLVVGLVKSEWDMTILTERPKAILVDAIGLGAGVADRLRELGLPCQAVNVSEKPALDGSRYRNLRTELWFAMRDWFGKFDCYIPRDEKLLQELAAQKYKVLDSSGKVIALPKDEMRKFIHPRRSPDRADALMLTFSQTAASIIHGASASNWKKKLVRGVKGVV